MARQIHVAKIGSDFADGTLKNPYLTISKAALEAKPGDTVIVHEGIYRECVKPINGGLNENCRITYTSAPNEKVEIRGSQKINSWNNVKGTVWRVDVDNEVFSDFNPFNEKIDGDWFIFPNTYDVHLGDVYLNGKSLYEASSLEELYNPQKRIFTYHPDSPNRKELLADPDGSLYQWFAEINEVKTTIYANFQNFNPNDEITEISVRKSCFYPEKTGINYITVRGFEMSQAASPWAPPTAEQVGLIGTKWSKGWIIEDNIIHDSKCSGVSIGRGHSAEQNMYTKYKHKPGYQYQMEAVFDGLNRGWCKENIGSHVIRNNIIYDCGQNAVVGNLGCIYSKIYNNHIYNIGVKHEFYGYEIAGIKLHAPIDTEITNNRIDHCTLGTWLDWQAQGVRVSGNLYYHNDRDLMVEVSHGPYIVDNNIFGSKYNFDNVAQGGAYINNLCCGTMRRDRVLMRATPYHYPHSTKVAGVAVVFGGDDRLINNIFIGGMEIVEKDYFCGTVGYNECPPSYEEYLKEIESSPKQDVDKYINVAQPAIVKNNAYFNGAQAYEKERYNFIYSSNPQVSISEQDEEVYLKIDLPQEFFDQKTEIQTTESLGVARVVGALYESNSGDFIEFDKDYFNNLRADHPHMGPFENLKQGENSIKIWPKNN